MVKLTGYGKRNCESEWRGMFICSSSVGCSCQSLTSSMNRHLFSSLSLSQLVLTKRFATLNSSRSFRNTIHRLTENHLWLRQTCSDVCIVEVPACLRKLLHSWGIARRRGETPYLRSVSLRRPPTTVMFSFLISLQIRCLLLRHLENVGPGGNNVEK